MRKCITLVLAVVLAGCSVGPDYKRPAVTAPESFSVSGETRIAQDWWKQFGSTELDRLMDTALLENHDIRASLHRVEQVRASTKIAGASLLPSVGASAGVSNSRNNQGGGSTSRYTAGAEISYELDLFGRNRAGVTAAKANEQASVFDKAALDLVVMGDVARTYFEVLNGRERLSVSDKNLKNANEILRIVKARFDAGSASGLEVAQQKSSVASIEASRAGIAQSLNVSENALAVLLAKAPGTLEVENNQLTGLRIPAIAPGQPSTLLSRRPDIRSAEEGLVAANANIGTARAAFFPSVNLGIDGSLAVAALGNPDTAALSLASAFSVPIFQGGRLEGGVEQATARQAELVENYRKAVLVSFQEVEDALMSVKTAEINEKSFDEARKQAQIAYDLSRQKYDSGGIDFQTLINVQNTLLSAESDYTQSRNDRLNAAIDLFLSLGGGWKEG